VLANAARAAAREGHFRADVDPEQFAHDFLGIMLAYHHGSRLMRDPKATQRAEAAFESLVRSAGPTEPALAQSRQRA
jgi:hypothetical protein